MPEGPRRLRRPGCGREPFLKQIEGFQLYPDALSPDRIVRLYDRDLGVTARAANIADAAV